MHRLCEKKLTVATTESCTGGMLASLLTDIERAGRGFERGFVTYTKQSRQNFSGFHGIFSIKMMQFRKRSRVRWRKVPWHGPALTSR